MLVYGVEIKEGFLKKKQLDLVLFAKFDEAKKAKKSYINHRINLGTPPRKAKRMFDVVKVDTKDLDENLYIVNFYKPINENVKDENKEACVMQISSESLNTYEQEIENN